MKGNVWGAGEVLIIDLDADCVGILNYIKVCKGVSIWTFTKYIFVEMHMTRHQKIF